MIGLLRMVTENSAKLIVENGSLQNGISLAPFIYKLR